MSFLLYYKILLYLQIGITSPEIGNCFTGTIFIRVSAFYNWILKKTRDATYCQNPFWFKTKEKETTHTTILTTEETSTTTKVHSTAEEKQEENNGTQDLPPNSNALNIQNFISLNFFTAIIGQWMCSFSGE